MYALDTNTVIYFLKGKGRVAERLLGTPPREIALPSVVVYELEVGTAKMERPGKRRRQLNDLIHAVNLLPFDLEAARMAARLRVSLERAGQKIGPIDTLIAATALCHGASLVTHNVKEFGRVEGLDVRDWFA